MELSASQLDELRHKARVERAVAAAGVDPTTEKVLSNHAVQILSEWAFAKVELERLQKEAVGKPPEETAPSIKKAISDYRRANRKKQRLDVEYRDHHRVLAAAEEYALKKSNQGEASRVGDAANKTTNQSESESTNENDGVPKSES